MTTSSDASRLSLLKLLHTGGLVFVLLYSVIFLYLDMLIQAGIELSWASVFAIALVWLHFRGTHLRAIVWGQIVAVLAVTSFLTMSLGGLIPSKGMMIWCLFAPFAAMLWLDLRATTIATLAALALMLASSILSPPRWSQPLPDTVAPYVALTNIGGTAAVVLVMLWYFQLRLHRELHEKKQAREEARRLNAALVQLAKDGSFTGDDLPKVLAAMTEQATDVLAVERCSVWLLDESGETLCCQDLFSSREIAHSKGATLELASNPTYFSILRQLRAVAADDAQRDSRIGELVSGYLEPLGIASKLDAPVRIQGRLVGVICLEHIGAARSWSPDERSYAAALADLLALALEAAERKQAQDAHKGLEAQLQRAQKLESLGVLAGGIAHDFNNLLVSVLGRAELAQMCVEPDSTVRPHIDAIATTGERAAELCDQLLAYSGRGHFVIRHLDISEVVSEANQLLRVSISKRATLEYRLEDELPAIEADPSQLRQIIVNLITNASEALGDAGGRISVATGQLHCDELQLRQAILSAAEPGDFVYLEVNDTGCGMDERTQQRLFDPFFSTKFTGRGLGMAGVLGIVRGHKGAIMLRSAPGKGSRFRVLFPAVRGRAGEAQRRQLPIRNLDTKGAILLADDDETVRYTSREMLKRVGAEVVEAEDGQEALELFEAQPDRFVGAVLDLTMPRLGGLEAAQALRELRPDLPIVLVSGYSKTEFAKLAQEQGMAFVQKPFHMEALVTKVRELMGAEEG